MHPGMVTMTKDSQILNTIVQTVTVDMMDVFAFKDRTNLGLSNIAMLSHPLCLARDLDYKIRNVFRVSDPPASGWLSIWHLLIRALVLIRAIRCLPAVKLKSAIRVIIKLACSSAPTRAEPLLVGNVFHAIHN